jgi:hypothetical protein
MAPRFAQNSLTPRPLRPGRCGPAPALETFVLLSSALRLSKTHLLTPAKAQRWQRARRLQQHGRAKLTARVDTGGEKSTSWMSVSLAWGADAGPPFLRQNCAEKLRFRRPAHGAACVMRPAPAKVAGAADQQTSPHTKRIRHPDSRTAASVSDGALDLEQLARLDCTTHYFPHQPAAQSRRRHLRQRSTHP